jgi:hypothetical protein
MSTLLVTGCVNTAINSSAVCDSTLELRKEHARALSESPHDASVLSGAYLLQTLNAGCRNGGK